MARGLLSRGRGPALATNAIAQGAATGLDDRNHAAGPTPATTDPRPTRIPTGLSMPTTPFTQRISRTPGRALAGSIPQ
jgi:hypothetical protein